MDASLWSTWRIQRCVALAAALLHFIFFIICAAAARDQARYAYDDDYRYWIRALYTGVTPTTSLQTVFALLTLVALVAYVFRCVSALRQPTMLFSDAALCHPQLAADATLLLLKLLCPLTAVSFVLFIAGIAQYCYWQSFYSDSFWDELGPPSQGWIVVWPMTFVVLLATLWLTLATYKAAKVSAANLEGTPMEEGVKYAMAQQHTLVPMYSVPYAQQPVHLPPTAQPSHMGGWTTS